MLACTSFTNWEGNIRTPTAKNVRAPQMARMIREIKTRYYWPCITCDGTHYVRCCRNSKSLKGQPIKPAGLLQPFYAMSLSQKVDSRGARVECITHYAETTVFPKGSAEVVNCFIHRVVLRHGTPEVLTAEWGTVGPAKLRPGV